MVDINGERHLIVRLGKRPLRLQSVSVQQVLAPIGTKPAKEEHLLYFASKLHRGGVQLCRFLAHTTQHIDVVFEAHDVLHFKAFGDTPATMFLIGNLLEAEPGSATREASQDTAKCASLDEAQVGDVEIENSEEADAAPEITE